MADSQKKHTQTSSYRRETRRVTTFLLICQESKSRRPGLSFCWRTNDTNPAVNVIARFGVCLFFPPSPRSIWISVRNIPGNMRALFLNIFFFISMSASLVSVEGQRRVAGVITGGSPAAGWMCGRPTSA